MSLINVQCKFSRHLSKQSTKVIELDEHGRIAGNYGLLIFKTRTFIRNNYQDRIKSVNYPSKQDFVCLKSKILISLKTLRQKYQ